MGGQFTSNLRPRWMGSDHAKEGFQVSKRKWKGSKGESARGSKNKGIAPWVCCQSVYMYIIIV
jgi:hypothetical protein